MTTNHRKRGDMSFDVKKALENVDEIQKFMEKYHAVSVYPIGIDDLRF